LDPDEAEPLSAFDIDAANAEGQYMPKWGEDSDASLPHNEFTLSSLGFDIQSMSREEVLDDAKMFLSNASQSQSVLLDGATDNPGAKITNNGYDFSGSVRDGDIDKGLFVCAIGGLPLFTTANLSPTTASSGWLSFAEPVSHEHITLVYPERSSNDQRIEVICTRSQCHLGHYFGKGEGYCINASALNFISIDATSSNVWNKRSNPISWHTIMMETTEVLPSQKMLQQVILRNAVPIDICLGAGCFWHVEFALRRLPGIINTTVGYNGGMTTSPTYKDICTGGTNHAEVVMCKFDPAVLDPRVLIDCFLAMHDPTNIRSHGNRAKKTGQYRSCIFVSDKEMESIALSAINDCSKKLGKLLSTVVEYQTPKDSWIAETRHQRHDERKGNKTEDNLRTLAPTAWLMEYGRRSESIWGSSESIMVDDEDDGMARMMI
jgi:methionine-S-sulfoxide reductase